MFNRLLVERNVAVPMRDGTILRADVYRPEADTRVPAIVGRLPYNKNLWGMQSLLHPMRAAEAGFAVVWQDTRGRFASDGVFYPFVHEGQDGYDTVEWVAAQPWCNGAVGMAGGSYFGATQWLAAAEQPPHLKAIFPVITASEYYEGWTYQGGAFQLGFNLLWTLAFLAPDTATRLAKSGQTDPQEMMRLLLATDAMDAQYGHLPLATHPLLAASQAAPYYRDWLAHASRDEYWRATAINERYARVQVPAYNVGGWYDLFLLGTLENYARMRQEGGSEIARRGQRLLIGPWAHGDTTGAFPDWSYGILSSLDVVDTTGLQLQFFGQHLRGEESGVLSADAGQEAPVRLFVMGEPRPGSPVGWRDEREWPLARTQYVPWYLHSDGHAAQTGGTLAPAGAQAAPGDGAEGVDVYLYDPRNPTPTVGGPNLLPGMGLGANSGPRDQREVEARADVLVYTSAPLEQPLEVTGPLSVTLYAASSAPDTDWVARLCDVYPDGASRILAEGILRARYRDGTAQPRLLEPGQVYAFHINLVATSNLFQPGHRVRLDITSSSFPRFDRNPNTGRTVAEDGDADLQPALQRVFHSAAYPSHVLLPVIPR